MVKPSTSCGMMRRCSSRSCRCAGSWRLAPPFWHSGAMSRSTSVMRACPTSFRDFRSRARRQCQVVAQSRRPARFRPRARPFLPLFSGVRFEIEAAEWSDCFEIDLGCRDAKPALYQAGRSISAAAPGRRRLGRGLLCREARDPLAVARSAIGEETDEGGDSGSGQQDRPDRPGHHDQRRELPRAGAGCRIDQALRRRQTWEGR